MSYQPPSDLPIEFRLALACSRWSYTGDSADAVTSLAARVDWARFLDTCRRHRVQGLVWHTLEALRVPVPAAVQVALAGDARAIAAHGLQAARESARLLTAFSSAGVPLRFLKGLTLAQQVYCNAFMKMSADLDILVLPEDVARSASLLGELGYAVEIPDCFDQLVRWHGSRKESVWRGKDRLVLELHSRVADQIDLLPDVDARSPHRTVSVAANIDLPTLADEEQFAYLSVHGASSAWFRLKWITDLAAFLHDRSPTEIEALYDRSQQLGAGRATAQALLLAQRLNTVSLPVTLAEQLRTPVNRWLARAALANMLRGEPTDRLLGTRTIHLTQFFLRPGLRYKIGELLRQARVAAGIF